MTAPGLCPDCCPDCGTVPGLHRPDGSCPLTRRGYQRAQSLERVTSMTPRASNDVQGSDGIAPTDGPADRIAAESGKEVRTQCA